MYVLFEHATGYGVFKIENMDMLLLHLETAVHDLGSFQSIVNLIGFSPFKSAAAALDNISAISEGVLPEDLKHFLDITIPKDANDKLTLGVIDPKLGAAISEALSIKCSHVGVVPDVLRGIRHHFHNLIKEFTAKNSAVAQLSLGHSFSYAKIKFNVNRVDNMIIQSSGLLDQLDKDISNMSMRIREWYSVHFPELDKMVSDNYTFSRLVKFIKNRKSLTTESLDGLNEITMDSSKAKAILDASKSSIGTDIIDIDLLTIEMLAARVISSSDRRKMLAEYLRSKMSNVAPNLATLIGDELGARLIAHAGSLINLAKYPATTVQLLGAEKALFRALKTRRRKTPKYGLIFHSTFIGRASAQKKGQISKYLANKCSIAARIDCFSEMPSRVFGENLRLQVEDRLKFYITGDVPKRNIEVMKEALEVYNNQMNSEEEKKKGNKDNKADNGEQPVVKEEIKSESAATATNGDILKRNIEVMKEALEDYNNQMNSE